MRPKYKELYEKAQRQIDNLMKTGFTISHHNKGHRDCEHIFEDWKLESDGGFAFYTWTCSECGMEVNQSVGERVKPENIPIDLSVSSWSE